MCVSSVALDPEQRVLFRPDLPEDVDPGAPPQEMLDDAYQPHVYDPEPDLRHVRQSAPRRKVTFTGNNFQANYSGGDGNDFTLTIVP